MANKMTRLDYCQYLLVTQINYALTNFADHSSQFGHDRINRFLTCIYVNPILDQFWLIDYRIYEPDHDGKTKLEHAKEMLLYAVHHKQLSFQGVLMDTWYATKKFMLLMESLNKQYYCPLKNNRQVDDSAGIKPYQRVDSLEWNNEELITGKSIKIKGFPQNYRVKLFRVVVSTHRTDYVVTNDFTQDSTEATQEEYGFGWKIEQLHREGKQLTGWEKCQCRKARIQRNHIGCALLVWVRLKYLALANNSNVYQLKNALLGRYLIEQLKNPSLKMIFA